MSLKRFGGMYMKKDLDDIFNEEKLDREIKRVKRKSRYRIFIISAIVSISIFIGGFYLNRYMLYKKSSADMIRQKNIVRLTIPNGFISKSYYDFEFLGGKSYHRIGRQVGDRTVILEDRRYRFGISIGTTMTSSSSPRIIRPSDTPSLSFWETGYRKLIYYHPDIEYKVYRQDLNILDEIPSGKLIEMGLSFDKGYKPENINIVLPDINKSWIWLDLFTDEEMDKYRFEAENYDSSAAYIPEDKILGISSMGLDIFSYQALKFRVLELFQVLGESPIEEHSQISEEYIIEDSDKFEMPMMIGAIVYGTKDELQRLVDNPHIKASSIGVVVDMY